MPEDALTVQYSSQHLITALRNALRLHAIILGAIKIIWLRTVYA